MNTQVHLNLDTLPSLHYYKLHSISFKHFLSFPPSSPLHSILLPLHKPRPLPAARNPRPSGDHPRSLKTSPESLSMPKTRASMCDLYINIGPRVVSRLGSSRVGGGGRDEGPVEWDKRARRGRSGRGERAPRIGVGGGEGNRECWCTLYCMCTICTLHNAYMYIYSQI